MPEILKYAEDIRELRKLQKSIIQLQFRRESPSDDIILPALAASTKSKEYRKRKTDQSDFSQIGGDQNLANSTSIADLSPVRSTMDFQKASKIFEEIKQDLSDDFLQRKRSEQQFKGKPDR